MNQRPSQLGQLLCVGIAGPRLARAERLALARVAPGGVILFRRNYEDPKQLHALCAQLHALCDPPPLIAVDQEGGRVIRLGPPFIQLPAARELARSQSPAQVAASACAMARELAAAGIDIDLAPVLDVLTVPHNAAIGDRAFGRTPAKVSRYGLAFMAGLQQGGVLACVKHFPGHGNVREDSHLKLPVSQARQESLRRTHLAPFAAAFAAGAPMAMVAHILMRHIDRTRPATLSAAVIEGLLRGEMGFAGLVASDDLWMEALAGYGTIAERACLTIEAGADWALICHEPDAAREALAALQERGLARRRIGAALGRVKALRRRLRQLQAQASAG